MHGLRMTRIAQRMISPRGRSERAQVRRTRPGIEALEARLVLSSPAIPSISSRTLSRTFRAWRSRPIRT